MPRDVGKFVGYYFYVLACVSIASMFLGWLLGGGLHYDFSFILLLLAAPYLIKHNSTARKWTIRVCGFLLTCLAAMCIYAAIAGTEGMRVTLFSRIEHPTLWHVAAVAGVLGLLVGLPLVLLLTPKARQEFQAQNRFATLGG